MCGRFTLIRTTGVDTLATELGVSSDQFRFSDDCAPGNAISMVVERGGERMVKEAFWWLYLRHTPQGLKPHPDYFSINTNWQKLSQKREYRESRCIIPVSGFVESQGGKNPHLLQAADGSAMALGGLWKEWFDDATGQLVNSASIITLPGHPKMEAIHRKAFPLWLPESGYDDWLNEKCTDTSSFQPWLTPRLHKSLRATPVDRASSKEPIAEAFELTADV